MKFKTLALATTSLVALGLVVAPASAAPVMMGDLSLAYGHVWENIDFGSEGSDNDYPVILGQGRVNLPYSDTVNIQLDAVGRASMDDVFGNKSSHFGLGGHINYRDGQGLLGVFASTGRVSEILSSPVYMAGLEGQFFCGQWTFDGKLAYLDTDSDSGILLGNAGLAQIGGTYYASKKLKLVAGLTYVDGEVEETADVKEWAWNVGVHYWFGASMPVSGFIEYRGRNVDIDISSFSLDENTVNAGVTFHFGGDGFQDADRNGASETLPDYSLFRVLGSAL